MLQTTGRCQLSCPLLGHHSHSQELLSLPGSGASCRLRKSRDKVGGKKHSFKMRAFSEDGQLLSQGHLPISCRARKISQTGKKRQNQGKGEVNQQFLRDFEKERKAPPESSWFRGFRWILGRCCCEQSLRRVCVQPCKQSSKREAKQSEAKLF